MTGYQSKKAAAQDKLDDDDIQVYKDDGNALLIAYQSGYYDGKKQRPWVGLTDEDMKDPKTHNFDFIYGARWAEVLLKKRNA